MSTFAIAFAAALVFPVAAGAGVPKSARGVALTACERGTGGDPGAAVYEARMRAVPRSARMQLRYTLQVRTPERGRFAAVAAPGFGAWLGPSPGTARYVYTKRVENLIAPASYRVKVRFRWLDATGKVIRRAKAFSAACRQPDPRPNLAVRSLGVQPGHDASHNLYVAFVRNTGRSAADPSLLEMSAAGMLLGSVPVDALAPGEGVLVSLEGPACAAGEEVAAEADADEAVDERNEADNRISRPCPAASG